MERQEGYYLVIFTCGQKFSAGYYYPKAGEFNPPNSWEIAGINHYMNDSELFWIDSSENRIKTPDEK